MKKITLSEAQQMFPGVDVFKLHSSLGALGFQVDPEGDGWVRPNTQKEHLKKAGTVKTDKKAAAAKTNGSLGGRRALEWQTWRPGFEPRGLGEAVGLAIAEGRGKYRPRVQADDFNGIVEVAGQRFRARCRWPDGAQTHEVHIEYALL